MLFVVYFYFLVFSFFYLSSQSNLPEDDAVWLKLNQSLQWSCVLLSLHKKCAGSPTISLSRPLLSSWESWNFLSVSKEWMHRRIWAARQLLSNNANVIWNDHQRASPFWTHSSYSEAQRNRVQSWAMTRVNRGGQKWIGNRWQTPKKT